MQTVAFLGLGAIGAPMARRIAAAGFPLRIWNRTRDRAAAFAKGATATVAATAADAARDADVVVTCLSTSADVEQVLDDGVLEALRAGMVLVDCTSGDPATSRRIATRLSAWDVG